MVLLSQGEALTVAPAPLPSQEAFHDAPTDSRDPTKPPQSRAGGVQEVLGVPGRVNRTGGVSPGVRSLRFERQVSFLGGALRALSRRESLKECVFEDICKVKVTDSS